LVQNPIVQKPAFSLVKKQYKKIRVFDTLPPNSINLKEFPNYFFSQRELN